MRAVPHLTKLQEDYSDDLIVIGVSDEKPEVVKPVVQRLGSKMGYRIAIDSSKEMWRTWAQAAGLNGIPAAFLVGKDKKIAFIGHPSDPKFDKTVKAVISGRYDPKLMAEAEPIMKQVDYSRKMRDWKVCYRYLDQIIEKSPRVFNDEALLKFRIMVLEQNAPQEAVAYGRTEYARWYAEDADALDRLATLILTDERILKSDEQNMKALALELADSAYNLARTDPETMSVLAMAQYHNGNFDEAVTLARKAYLTAEPESKERFKRQLDSYTRGQQMSRKGG